VTLAWELFVSFLRIGLFGFGGGPSMIPLIQIEVVNVRGWVSAPEFLDAFALGTALPGPIATKLAGYVGYQQLGIPGAAVAMFALIAPTIVAMLALAALFARFKHHRLVQGFLFGVRPVVLALLALVVWEFYPSALVDPWTWAMAAAASFVTVFTKVHPAWAIAGGAVLGLILFT
jgi:chromate transporter